MKARSADFWSGLVLGGLGAYIIVHGVALGVPGAGRPGAGLLSALVRHRHERLVALARFRFFKTRKRDASIGRMPPRALAAWAAFAVMCAAFKLIGFLPASRCSRSSWSR